MNCTDTRLAWDQAADEIKKNKIAGHLGKYEVMFELVEDDFFVAEIEEEITSECAATLSRMGVSCTKSHGSPTTCVKFRAQCNKSRVFFVLGAWQCILFVFVIWCCRNLYLHMAKKA